MDGNGVGLKRTFDVVLYADIGAPFLDKASFKAAVHHRSFTKGSDHMVSIKCFSRLKLQLKIVFRWKEDRPQHLFPKAESYTKDLGFFIKIIIKDMSADTEATQIQRQIYGSSASGRKLRSEE